MFSIGMIALLSVAQAETPKKSKDKTEQSDKKGSNDKKDSSGTKSSSKKSSGTKKSSTQSSSTQKSSSKPKAPTKQTPPAKKVPSSSQPSKKPTGTTKVSGSPAKQQTGSEQQSTPSAHTPIGSTQTQSNRPVYNRAPNNVERPQVGSEQQSIPSAHSPIGNQGGNRTPSYERAPEIDRPQVGKEEQNTPSVHSPIGAPEQSNRPERTKPNREPEGRIDRKPPTNKEPVHPKNTRTPQTDTPSQGRVERTPPSNKQPPKPNKERKPSDPKEHKAPIFDRDVPQGSVNGRVDRTTPDPSAPSNSQSASPGKSQVRSTPTGGLSTSRRQNNNRGSSNGGGMGQTSFGLGTLSFASDYVDGGAYQDGGVGMSLGFRPVPQFEIEASYGQYTDSTLESSRNRLNRPIQLVGQFHMFPTQVVSPFVSGGYVWNPIDIDDVYLVDGEQTTAQQEDLLTGLALGAGVTFNVHQRIALELDGRLFQYNNLEQFDDAGDTATLVSMGVVVNF
jgi:opacity protein-like surface antigen